jgi:transposase
MTNRLFEQALGIKAPWYVSSVDFSAKEKRLTINVDFVAGSRFEVEGLSGAHGVHDTVVKRYRHLHFFEHECYLEARVPRCNLPEGGVRLVTPDWEGALSGFTLLFEALVIALCQQMSFSGAGRIAGISAYQAKAICKRYVGRAVDELDLKAARRLAIDETSRARGHHYVTLVADADARRVIFVADGRDSGTIEELSTDLKAHGGDPLQVESVSIDMSPAYIKGVGDHLPNAAITFDKYHVVAKAGAALDETRRKEQRKDRSLKGMRWKLLRNPGDLDHASRSELEAFAAQATTKRTARAWMYKEQLREILQRKQVNVVRGLLEQWCIRVMRSKVEPMKEVAAMIRNHIEGIVAWARTRQTNGFLEAINGLFQAAKRRARGYASFETIRTVIFLIAGKLDFSAINPHCR